MRSEQHAMGLTYPSSSVNQKEFLVMNYTYVLSNRLFVSISLKLLHSLQYFWNTVLIFTLLSLL